MKLFKFEPTRFVRMYAMATDINDLIKNADELFEKFHRNHYDYLFDYDGNFFDEDDVRYKEEAKNTFMENIKDAEEADFFIDAHY
jgi:adenine C2-methylase RlmN of 23S rRNA A2503 and tRNA A37